MDIVLDACSIMNLINGNCLDKVLQLPNHRFFIGDMLFEQELLNDFQKLIVQACIDEGLITILESKASYSAFNLLKQKYQLGLGETECILLCKTQGYIICTDDRKARLCSTGELGKECVVGSLYMLKECVGYNLISCDDSILAYCAMINKGGFLPKQMTKAYFCS